MQMSLKKLKIELAYDPAGSLLGLCLKECKSAYSRDICTPVLTAALFTTLKLLYLPRCSSINEWIKQMWYIYTMEYYSDIKNEIMSFGGKRMELEIIMLSEISHTQKDKNCMFGLVE
jgi:hypothetical protein